MQEAGLLVPGRWTAAAYTCLMVALYVAELAIVNLTVHDHVQLDRVTGTSAERYGDLVLPGITPVHLAAGTYVRVECVAVIFFSAVRTWPGTATAPAPDPTCWRRAGLLRSGKSV